MRVATVIPQLRKLADIVEKHHKNEEISVEEFYEEVKLPLLYCVNTLSCWIITEENKRGFNVAIDVDGDAIIHDVLLQYVNEDLEEEKTAGDPLAELKEWIEMFEPTKALLDAIKDW